MGIISSVFLQHPWSGNQTYLQHQRQALWAAGQLLISAGAAIVHAFVPALFQRTMGRRVGAVVEVFKSRMPPASR